MRGPLSIKTGSGINPRKRTWVTSSYLRQYPRLVPNTYHAAEMLARSFIVTIGYSDATLKFCNRLKSGAKSIKCTALVPTHLRFDRCTPIAIKTETPVLHTPRARVRTNVLPILELAERCGSAAHPTETATLLAAVAARAERVARS